MTHNKRGGHIECNHTSYIQLLRPVWIHARFKLKRLLFELLVFEKYADNIPEADMAFKCGLCGRHIVAMTL